jgi:hypothetical protein
MVNPLLMLSRATITLVAVTASRDAAAQYPWQVTPQPPAQAEARGQGERPPTGPAAGESAVAAILRRAGVAPTESALAGTDAKARAQALDSLERGYPLPRSVLDRENTPPPDAEAVMDRLGLVRRPGAPVTDLSGRAPTRGEITDALRPR